MKYWINLIHQHVQSRVQRARDEQGSSMIEMAVSSFLIAVLVVGLLGALIVGLRAGATLDMRDLGRVAGRSQLEYILGLPLAQSYSASPATPSTMNVETETETVRSNVLQSLDIQAISTLEGLGVLSSLETYKASRLLDVSIAPPSGGLEINRVVTVPSLNQNQNFYVVVQVLPSVTLTDVSVQWRLSEFGKGLITIFSGMPFGDGSGLAIGGTGGKPKVASGNIHNDNLGVIARGVSPGFYTVHVNFQNKLEDSSFLSITCLCPLVE